MTGDPGKNRRTWIAALLPAAVYLVAIACLVGGRQGVGGFPLDDGWIHRVYARSFAFGHGFQYNPGQQEAGSTSPLWAIVTAPAQWLEPLGVSAVIAAVKVIGVGLGLATLHAVGCAATRISGSVFVGCVSATLLALEPRLLFSALSGMESNLVLALWAGGAAALLAGRSRLALALWSLAPVSRPEAVLLVPLAVLVVILLTRQNGWDRHTLAAWIIPGVPVGLWVVFCLAVNGHPLPNTAYMKTIPVHLGRAQIALAARAVCDGGLLPPWLWLPGIGVHLIGCLSQVDRKKALWLLGVLVIPPGYLLGVVATRRMSLEGYYWTRWMDPATLMLMIPCCIGWGTALGQLAALPGWRPDGGRPRVNRSLARGLVGIGAAVCLAAGAPFYCRSFADRKFHLEADSRCIDTMNVRAGFWIHEHTPSTAVVAVNDAGAIRYFGERRTIDLMGLNDSAIAHGVQSERQALARADWLVIFPGWFRGQPLWGDIQARFEARGYIQMAPEDYTIADAPNQTTLGIYSRRRPQR